MGTHPRARSTIPTLREVLQSNGEPDTQDTLKLGNLPDFRIDRILHGTVVNFDTSVILLTIRSSRAPGNTDKRVNRAVVKRSATELPSPLPIRLG